MIGSLPFEYWECSECGFDCIVPENYISHPVCPLCAGDTGRDGNLKYVRAARDDDKVEGRDWRKG